MTAIAGIVSQPNTHASEALTRQLLDAQRLYGSSELRLATLGEATFGISPHRKRGDKPAIIANRWIIVADLRLDNRGELEQRIGGSIACGMSDAELVLAAWIKAGQRVLSWIAGDFALAIYDATERTLWLARDISGELPLFYSQVGGRAAFASMAGGLQPFVGDFALDKLRLALSACDVGHDEPGSHYEQIKSLRLGELVRITDAGVKSETYWNPPTRSDIRPEHSERWVEAYREVLDTAVAARVNDCPKPIATQLSSGLDSNAVTATAARLLGSPDQLIAFTSAPRFEAAIPPTLHRIADESEIAAGTAAMYGLRHVIVRDTVPIREVMTRHALLCDQPMTTAPNLAWLIQLRAEAAALGCHRVLSGVFGNVTLHYGGLYVLAELVRRGRLATWLTQTRLAAGRPDTRWRGVLYNSFGPWMPPVAKKMLLKIFMSVQAGGESAFVRREWLERVRCFVGDQPFGLDRKRDRIKYIRELDYGALRKGWMAADGLDERDPLSDRRLMEFSFTLPAQQLYWNGVSRPLARAALADRLPRSVLELKVRGLQGADWAQRFTKAEAGAMLEEISANGTSKELLDMDAMRAAIERWPTEDTNSPSAFGEFRRGLVAALATGMFAVAHEQRACSA